MHVHILGICGTLMGSIALLAKAQGHHVSGSDNQVYPPMSTQLREASILSNLHTLKTASPPALTSSYSVTLGSAEVIQLWKLC